ISAARATSSMLRRPLITSFRGQRSRIRGLHRSERPYLHGIVTPSEVMTARDLGISFLKLFPAAAVRGLALLQALAPVFPGVTLCPSGGVDERSAANYLALPNVPMVGGHGWRPERLRPPATGRRCAFLPNAPPLSEGNANKSPGRRR